MADIPGQIEHLVEEDRLARPVWYEWLLGLQRFVANANAAWISFTPTVIGSTVAGSPTITSASRYRRIGKTVSVFYDVTLTNLGGATGFPRMTLPVATTASVGITGSEVVTSGKMVSFRPVSSTAGLIVNYDNSSPLVVNSHFLMDGTYEVV